MNDFVLLSVFMVIVLSVFVFIGHKNHVADWGGFTINVVDGWIRIYCRYFHHFIYQPIPVSDDGPTLLACNHISGLDSFLIVAACRHPIRFMIAKEEYERFGFTWLFRAAGCIPVERSGRVETAFNAALSALHKNEVVLLFPEGSINKTAEPLRKLKMGIIKLAKMAEVPITALRVQGMHAQGYTVPALLLPSHSFLYVLADLNCENKTDQEALMQLARLLVGKYTD